MPQIFGKYILLDKISHGGMGEVYKAKSFGVQGFEKLFAIKRILPKLSSSKPFIDMLGDEAKISVSLSHSNIAQIYEFDCIDKTYYLAMEFIHGKDVRSILESVDAIPVEIACYVIAELAKGLHYLHTATDGNGKKLDIVHRDISPRNIIISFEGEVKIIDFGIANASNRVFKIGNDIFVGKYAYMSPEQLLGQELTHRSDIFSAGIVLYELLFKKLPLGKMRNINLIELGKEFIDVDPKLDKRLLKTIPEELETILGKATAIDPHNRYQDALTFYKDLMGFIVNFRTRVDSFVVGSYIKNIFSNEIYPGQKPFEFTEQKKVIVLHVQMDIGTRGNSDREKLLSHFKEIIEIVQKNGGTLYRLKDTNLIALYGIPKNREDDISLALETALKIKHCISSIEFDGKLAIAVDYVNVVVSFKGDDLKNFTISADALQKAKDLIVFADDREIIVGSNIKNLTQREFEITPKGGVFCLGDSSSALSRYAAHAQEIFINRVNELAIVEKAIEEVNLETGKNSTIVGDAGIGKTALIREIGKRAGEKNIQVFIERAHPYIKSPFGIFKELIIQLLSLEQNDHESISLKVAQLAGFGLSRPELDGIKSILSMRFKSEALDILPPDKQKLLIIVALQKVMRGLAHHKTVFVFENLHTADELSLELLDVLKGQGGIPHALIIKTYRPKFLYDWKNKDPQEMLIELDNFNEDTLGNYLKTFTSNIPVEKKTLMKIYTHSLGNPLFAGELIKNLLTTKKLHIVHNEYSLIENTNTVVIPDSIYSVLAARVDSLTHNAKKTLREACVIGHEFSFDEVHALSSLDAEDLKAAIEELLSTGILSSSQKSGEYIYTFTHTLMKEVVYKSIIYKDRAQLHTEIADYLYEKYRNVIEEHTQELSYHYSKGTNDEKALHFLIKAGDENLNRSLIAESNLRYVEAIACFMNNENLFKDRESTLIELNYKVGITNQILGKLTIAEKSLSRALKLSHDHGIEECIPKIYHQTARVHKIKGDYKKALDLVHEALRLSQQSSDQKEMLEFLHEKASILRLLFHDEKNIIEMLEDGLRKAQSIQDTRLESMFLNSLGVAYADSKHTKALVYYKKALEIRKEKKERLGVAIVLGNISAVFYKISLFDKAVEYAEKSLQISSDIGDALGICLNLANLGEIYLAEQELDKASVSLNKALENSSSLSWKEGITLCKIHLAFILALKNENLVLAKNLLEDASAAAKELQNHEFIAKIYLVQSKIASLENDQDRAQKFFNDAQKLIQEHNLSPAMKPFEKVVLENLTLERK